MSDKIEIQGKTVEAAVSEALLQLGARRDEVEIKVLEEPKSGFMGFLGGRAARVMVRKKRSRGRGGSGRDYRVENEDYKAHNLGKGRGSGRGGSSRGRPSGGSSGGSAKGRDDNRQAAREPNREEKSGSRRGSRGRGGRGRSQEAAGRSQNQDQRQDQKQDQPRGQRGGQRQDQRQGQRQDQRQGQQQDQRQDQQQSQQRDQQRDQQPNQQPNQQQDQPRVRGSRNRRGMPRDNRGRDASVDIRQDNLDQAPKEHSQPVGNAREDSSPRSETTIRPAQPDPVKTPEIKDVQDVQITPVVHEDPKPIEKKEENAVTKPKKPRRGFGGLGARIKERRLEAKAAEEALANPPTETASPAVEERPAATISSQAPASPSPDRMMRERRAPSFSRSRTDEEVILSDIKGTKYAKALGSVTDEGLDEALTELTDGMLARAGFPCQCETFPGEYRQIKVTTDDASAGMLIGRHGQAIDAVEHLVERMASNSIDARARINLDINNYRMLREESLAERVAEAAAAIKETGRPFHMEPMSARERRLVHMETAELDGLRTFTMDGSGGKHVVIAADEETRVETEPQVQPEFQDEVQPNTDEPTDEPTVDHPVDDAEERNNPDT